MKYLPRFSTIALILLCSFLTFVVKIETEIQKELVSHNSSDLIKQLETQKLKDYSIPEDYDASLTSPGWKCSSSSPSPSSSQKKVIFVHVFKTAGSTFRTFFDNYGAQCGRGVTTIIHCSDLTSKSLNEKNPRKKWRPKCTIKKTQTRSKKVISQGKKATRDHLQKYTDIAIGHMPYGIHKRWVVKPNKEPVIPQYITFFREPYVKFVSGRLFDNRNKHWNLNQAVTFIKKDIRERYKEDKYFNGYKSYLTTPDEKKLQNISQEEWMQFVKKNIIESHTIVGIVEYMSESLELIQSVIDVDREQTSSFKQLISPEKPMKKNQSSLSSSKIVGILKEDKEVFEILTELLKYEFEIYEFAIQVHRLQVEELRKKHGEKYTFKN